ncbi:hypothetical protein CXB51_009968 [Gossypium anomalum]|uniref:Uncharacterized protein n=1 Tax=Gossypium anomalum TaxID=47600 RepID=A0A8J5YTN6_9ROSI|nr:hypothetical protein CXB51_009968 [Gossypium anomalum]
MAILVQNSLKKVITGQKPTDENQTKWEELDEKALSGIQLCLTNNVLQEVLMEKTTSMLWKKMETLCMTKSLTNRLLLKQCLYTFRMAEGSSIMAHISEFVTLLNEFNVQNFCEGLKENEDDSWKKTKRKKSLSEKSQFDGLTLVSENSHKEFVDLLRGAPLNHSTYDKNYFLFCQRQDLRTNLFEERGMIYPRMGRNLLNSIHRSCQFSSLENQPTSDDFGPQTLEEGFRICAAGTPIVTPFLCRSSDLHRHLQQCRDYRFRDQRTDQRQPTPRREILDVTCKKGKKQHR